MSARVTFSIGLIAALLSLAVVTCPASRLHLTLSDVPQTFWIR